MPLSIDLAAASQAADALEKQITAITAELASTKTELAAARTDLTTANAEIERLKKLLEPAPPPPPPPPPPVDYPAQAPAGKVLWGAYVQGNADPTARHETPTGTVLGVHRTFFQWVARATNMVTMAKGDLAKGRLPWVSIKTPSWAAMGAGTHDGEIDQMLNALKALGGPVWLTIHHEPEGGGGVNAPDDPAGPAGHVAMNRRVRQRMTALSLTNVALVPVFMSWSWDSRSGRNPDQWWAPDIYDLLGVDHYTEQQTSLVTPVWLAIRLWAQARGVDVAVGEWGLRGSDVAAGANVKTWFDHAAGSASDGKGARVVGLAAFDSGENSPNGSWYLTGEQLKTFQTMLKDGRNYRI